MSFQTGKCVYLIKVNKKLYKIGKSQNLQKRISHYQTHLPILFKVVRQYSSDNMDELEKVLHVAFQHKRVKGEWFELKNEDLEVCDNIARSYSFIDLEKKRKKYKQIEFSDNPVLQVMEANEKYLRDYSQVAEDIKLGLSTNEILRAYDGNISKTVIQTLRKLLEHHTPNSLFVSKWLFLIKDLEEGLTIKQILDKYPGQVNEGVIKTIKRILRNQLY